MATYNKNYMLSSIPKRPLMASKLIDNTYWIRQVGLSRERTGKPQVTDFPHPSPTRCNLIIKVIIKKRVRNGERLIQANSDKTDEVGPEFVSEICKIHLMCNTD